MATLTGLGRYDGTRALGQRALTLARELGHRWATGNALRLLGTVGDREVVDEANAYLAEVADLARIRQPMIKVLMEFSQRVDQLKSRIDADNTNTETGDFGTPPVNGTITAVASCPN